MSRARRFTAELGESGRGGGRRSRLSVYGGITYLGLRKEIREEAGIDVGDAVDVVLERDDAPREVDLPGALATALARDDEARTIFESLAFTHRKEYVRWIEEAKREETRERRVEKTLAMLRGGTKHP